MPDTDQVDADPNTLSGPDAVTRSVGGVQGAGTGDEAGQNAEIKPPPLSGQAPQPEAGGGEIDWTELGHEPPIEDR